MLKKLDKCTVFSVIFFITVFLFWWLYRPAILHYHEIFQMFLWDSSYFCKLISMPGGMASYMAEFLVQFFYHPIAGAMIIATLTTGILILSQRIFSIFHQSNSSISFLTALPAIYFWYIMKDPDVMFQLLTATIGSMASAILSLWLIKRSSSHAITIPLMLNLALGYWLWGPAIYITLIISAAYIIKSHLPKWYIIAETAALLITIGICMYTIMRPQEKFLFGLEYDRYTTFSLTILSAILICAIAPIINIGKLTGNGDKYSKLNIALCIAGMALSTISYSYSSYQNYLYLDLAHQNKWGDIVADADENTPKFSNPMTLLNTALAKERKLANQMFKYTFNREQFLMDDLNNNLTKPLFDAEKLYWLGLNDYAIHYYYESRSGNKLNRGNSFTTRRLAECYIINGDYAIAMKHLKILRKTLYYKDEAERMIAMIKDSTTQDDPHISEMRQLRIQANCMESYEGMKDFLKILLKENPKNYMAFEYLMAYLLCEANFQELAFYIRYGESTGYKEMPMHLQEAMALFWYQQHKNLDNVPALVTPGVKARFSQNITSPGSYWEYIQSIKK